MSTRTSSFASKSNTFTMVFLDFDDTLFPSSIYQLFAQHLAIDLFELFSNSSIQKLQHTIIACIDSIRLQYKDQNIVFSVVSNASQPWLDYMFKGASPKLAILDEYFNKNDISIVSASSNAHDFVHKTEEVLDSNTKKHKYMWKYAAFASEITAFCRKSGKHCDKIISIGDGKNEKKALQRYANTHKIHSMHVQFINAPTIKQLIHEWLYLKYHLMDKIKGMQMETFCVDELYKECLLNCDNNAHCAGKIYQLPAIKQYFEYWMEHVDIEQKKMAIENVCTCIHRRLYSLKPRSAMSKKFKLILMHSICINSEFNDYFNVYFETIQNHSNRLEKRKINSYEIKHNNYIH